MRHNASYDEKNIVFQVLVGAYPGKSRPDDLEMEGYPI
jgi:hypothetical protein